MNLPIAIEDDFLFPVDPFNTHSTVQLYFMLPFFFLRHFYQAVPRQCAGDIIREQHTIIKRKIFLAEYNYLVVGIKSPVTLYKSAGTRPGSDNNDLLTWFSIQPYVYSTEFKIRFFTSWVYKV